MSHTWSVTYKYCTVIPDLITVNENTDTVGDMDVTEAACNELQRLADTKKTNKRRPPIGKLEFDDYSDEIHAFFYRNGKRIRFANLQYEGPNE